MLRVFIKQRKSFGLAELESVVEAVSSRGRAVDPATLAVVLEVASAAGNFAVTAEKEAEEEITAQNFHAQVATLEIPNVRDAADADIRKLEEQIVDIREYTKRTVATLTESANRHNARVVKVSKLLKLFGSTADNEPEAN